MTIKKSKKKIVVAKYQFTFAGVVYKVGDEFKGKKIQVDALIIKKSGLPTKKKYTAVLAANAPRQTKK